MEQALDMHLLVVHQIIAEVDYWLSFELYLTFHFLVIGLDIAPPLLADHILTRYICPLLVYILDLGFQRAPKKKFKILMVRVPMESKKIFKFSYVKGVHGAQEKFSKFLRLGCSRGPRKF